jgi:hypothetical protein
LFIDHEANENRWSPNADLIKYYQLSKKSFFEHISQLYSTRELFSFDFVKTVFIKTFIDKRYEREGDIHVWPDDHIELVKILEVTKNQASIVTNKDYLLYSPKLSMSEYKMFSSKCNDTKLLILKKHE